METLDILSLILLAAVFVIGGLLKRHTRKTLSDIDGMGKVTEPSDGTIIANL